MDGGKNILKHWILPDQGLTKGTCYEQAPLGNAPELNALDSNCNRDIHCAVQEHAGVPSSRRIAKGMMRIPQYSILKHFNTRGCIVPGCDTGRGRCDEGMNQVGCKALYMNASLKCANKNQEEIQNDNDGVEHHLLSM
eukprot:13378142-Ditylum_brightwellii.AAC.1